MQLSFTPPLNLSCEKRSRSLSTFLLSATYTSDQLTSSSKKSTLAFLALSDSLPAVFRMASNVMTLKEKLEASRERRRTPF